MKVIGITRFALRHFDSSFRGTKVVGINPDQLVRTAIYALQQGAAFVDGYAPFCKHLFLENPTEETCAGIARITPDNAHLLRSGYQARRDGELPVLTRWFEGLEPPRATHLDLVLYSYDQLVQESAGKPESERDVPEAAWSIVSINGELQPAESPMPPLTMMRNALGKDQGGSGFPLDTAQYLRSVEFWSTHAVVQ